MTFPWQNTFNFEKRDWLTVKKEELPDGSRLVQKANNILNLRSTSWIPLTKIFLFLLMLETSFHSLLSWVQEILWSLLETEVGVSDKNRDVYWWITAQPPTLSLTNRELSQVLLLYLLEITSHNVQITRKLQMTQLIPFIIQGMYTCNSFIVIDLFKWNFSSFTSSLLDLLLPSSLSFSMYTLSRAYQYL